MRYRNGYDRQTFQGISQQNEFKPASAQIENSGSNAEGGGTWKGQSRGEALHHAKLQRTLLPKVEMVFLAHVFRGSYGATVGGGGLMMQQLWRQSRSGKEDIRSGESVGQIRPWMGQVWTALLACTA